MLFLIRPLVSVLVELGLRSGTHDKSISKDLKIPSTSRISSQTTSALLG